MAVIYGVDTQQPVTSEMIRDAIIECFSKAHLEDAQKAGIENQASAMEFCKDKVKEAFDLTGGDFNKPTKHSLMFAVGYLAKFSLIFRDTTLIEKHKNEILELINLIPGEPLNFPGETTN